MKDHSQALNSFARKLLALLIFRGALQWITVWFFVWGVVVLAARLAHLLNPTALLLGLLGSGSPGGPGCSAAVSQSHRLHESSRGV